MIWNHYLSSILMKSTDNGEQGAFFFFFNENEAVGSNMQV